MKYVKKPIVVEAFQLGIDEEPEWMKEVDVNDIVEGYKIPEGNFIIKGIQGEIYPCKEDIFKATYDVYEEESK